MSVPPRRRRLVLAGLGGPILAAVIDQARGNIYLSA